MKEAFKLWREATSNPLKLPSPKAILSGNRSKPALMRPGGDETYFLAAKIISLQDALHLKQLGIITQYLHRFCTLTNVQMYTLITLSLRTALISIQHTDQVQLHLDSHSKITTEQ